MSLGDVIWRVSNMEDPYRLYDEEYDFCSKKRAQAFVDAAQRNRGCSWTIKKIDLCRGGSRV